uniref:Similar to MYC transcription factor n=1 Tax=Arundo donax TaxID=35708 RepID=A0A0A9E9P7_ARUDO
MDTRKNHSVSVTSSSTASSGAAAAPEMSELSSRRTRLRCSCSAWAAGVRGLCLRLSSSQPL